MTDHRDPDDAPDWEALARFRAGESGAEESAAVARWLAAHPVDASTLDSFDDMVGNVLAAASSAAPVDVDAALARLHARMDADAVAAPDARSTTVRRLVRATASPVQRARWLVAGLAAAGIAALVASSVRRADIGRTPVATATASSSERVYATKVGAIDSVTLSDGTRVLLGPGSRLTVAAGYGRGGRSLRLHGVARFAVHHDAAAPLTVYAGALEIHDVGTTFAVRAPSASAGVSVSVSEGEVRVWATAAAGSQSTLRAGDRAVIAPSGVTIGAVAHDGGSDEAWTRGQLEYHDASLALVRDDLHRWFGVELVTDSALATRRITGSFGRVNADDALRGIALALGAAVERSGDTATLRAAARVR